MINLYDLFLKYIFREEKGEIKMKCMKVIALSVVGTMLAIPQAYAAVPVPEMDGSGSIIAIGLVIGLVALLREKFFHK